MKFSLKTFLIVITVLAITMGYFIQRYRHVQGAFAALRKKEVYVGSGPSEPGVLRRFSETFWPTQIRVSVHSDLDDQTWELISEIEDLKELSVAETQSDPNVYRHFFSVSSIQELSIEGPDDSILDHFSNLERLERLVLKWDKQTTNSKPFKGNNLESLQTRDELTYLCLMYTSIDDSALKVVGKLPGLKTLILQGCDIGDQGIAHLVNLKSLEYLDLDETDVTEDCIDDLAKLESLESLSIVSTNTPYDSTLAISRLKHLPLKYLLLKSAYEMPDGKTLELQSVFPNCEIETGYVVPCVGEYLNPKKRAEIAAEEARLKADAERDRIIEKAPSQDDDDPFQNP